MSNDIDDGMSTQDHRLTKVWQQALITFLNISLAVSLVLVANGFAPYFEGVPDWTRVPNYIKVWIGAFIAVIATITITVSIYAPVHRRKADKISLYFLAPLAVVMCLSSMIWMLILGSVILDVVNGIALLGLTASLLRLLPFSDFPND